MTAITIYIRRRKYESKKVLPVIVLCSSLFMVHVPSAEAVGSGKDFPEYIEVDDENVNLKEYRKDFYGSLVEPLNEVGEEELSDRCYDASRGISVYGPIGWSLKALKWALRHYNKKLPEKVRPYASKVADYLDAGYAIEVMSITFYLIERGVPPDVAQSTVEWVVFVLG